MSYAVTRTPTDGPNLSVVGRPSKPLLSKEMIVDAAMAIVDESGISTMTTRAIAKRLGVGQASLYNHITSREELLDLLNARILAGVDLTPLDHPDWAEAVYGGTLAFLAALQQHPKHDENSGPLVREDRPVARLLRADARAPKGRRAFRAGLGPVPVRHRRLLHRAALNTEVDVEVNERQGTFPLVAEAMEVGRPADHHEATLRLLLNGLIATVDIPAAN